MVKGGGEGQAVAVTLRGGSLDRLNPTTTMPDSLPFDNSRSEQATPLATTILEWLIEPLAAAGYHRPFAKRLAVLVSGALVANTARRGDLATALVGLHLSAATPESIARRIARLLDDPAADPARLLPALFTPELLAELLRGELTAHAANVASGVAHHQRFRPLHLVVDLTSKAEQVVVLAVGLAYRGIVLPLAARTWPHNQALAPDTYWQHLLSALSEVPARVPSVLREHVLLVADRAFGVPRMVDAANALGWAWVLRVQGRVQVRLSEGTIRPLRTLVAHPGATWFSGFAPVTLSEDDPLPTVAVFQDAGWRPAQVIAVWDARADEPWLLITNRAASRDQVLAYAHRWAIERLFLSWKSHGWDLETLHLRTPARVGRLVAALAIATFCCLRIGAAHADTLLAEVADRAAHPIAVCQPPLPGFGPTPPDHRPYPAHFRLFSWGRKVLALSAACSHTPAFCRVLPHWQAPIWSIQCSQIREAAA
ncbi:MAG: transposase [Chloroflexota bacterium]